MRFVHTKIDRMCFFCGGIISRGEEAVLIGIRTNTGWINYQFFHTDRCCEAWSRESYVSRLLTWRISHSKPIYKYKSRNRKLGRPSKYINPLWAARLRSLIYYHNKRGHTEMVEVLTNKLKSLTIGKGSMTEQAATQG